MERGGHPTAFFFLGKGVYDQLLAGYERTLNRIMDDLGACESIHQVKGGKHHLALRDGAVCFAADAEVDAEAGPRMAFAVLMYDIAKR